MRGKYIVIEGSDGTGKSNQIDLLKKFLNKKGFISKTYLPEIGYRLSFIKAMERVLILMKLSRLPLFSQIKATYKQT